MTDWLPKLKKMEKDREEKRREEWKTKIKAGKKEKEQKILAILCGILFPIVCFLIWSIIGSPGYF